MKQSLLSILLASTFLSTSAIAMTIEPTLDDSAISYSEGTSTDYNFTIKEPDSVGALTTKYYKININKDKLSTSDNVSWTELDSKPSDMTNVVEVKLPNDQVKYFKYAYTRTNASGGSAPSLDPVLDDSSISYSEGSATDYNFTVQEADANGNLTTKYYKINIDKDKLTSSDNVSWTELDSKPSDMTNVVEVQIPNGQAKYFKYAYNRTNASGYDTTSTRVNNTLSSSDVTDVVFNGISSSSNGGAIYNTQNNSSVNIKADFIGNYVSGSGSGTSSSKLYTEGGAIYNYAGNSGSTAQIGNIEGDFIGNYASTTGSYNDAQGGAISNHAINSGSTVTIGDITGDFIGNHASSTGSYSYAQGGAIYNYANYGTAQIGDIIGDFIGNYASGSSYAYGGAIYNHAYNSNSTAQIGAITGDFIGNYASGSPYAYGGAIYNNRGTIGAITGDFIGNYVTTTGTGSISYYGGGAIYNYANYGTAQIGNIEGDFIGNYASGSSYAYGGAIYNHAYNSNSTAQIGAITGDFIGNYASGSSYASGGAIYNGGTIGDITGDFIGNYTSSTGSGTSSSKQYTRGGAIYNDGTNKKIGAITGDFIGNYAKTTGSYHDAQGGAIYNYISSSGYTATISDITGNFIGNYASSGSYSYAYGGAIYNFASSSNSTAQIGDITGDFIGNYALTTGRYSYAYGGAIYNYAYYSGSTAKISAITGDFIGNYASSTGSPYSTYGGAIYNYAYYGTAQIGDITGDFIGNYASGSSYAYGGAIYNYANYSDSKAEIGDITGDFIGNYANYNGGAIHNNANYGTAQIGAITGDFIGNYASGSYANGGAIYNYASSSQIGDITGDFIGNYASSSSSYADGGAIYNSGGSIGAITGDFIGNYASGSSSAYGGAIYNCANSLNYKAEIGDITGDFVGNYAKSSSSYAYGGAIYNYTYNGTVTIGNITGDFIGNYASSTGSYARGGAIYNYTSSGTANIGDITGDFIGNYAKSSSSNAYGGAIYSKTDITLSAKANGSSVIKDNYVEDTNGKRAEAIYMDGASTTLTLKAENNGTIEVHDIIDGVDGYDVKLTGDGTGSISVFNDINNADVAVEKVSVNMANGEVKDYSFNSLTVADGTNWNIDVDMVNETADNITSDSSSGTINIGKINNIGSTEETITVQVLKNGDGSDNLQLALGDNFKVLNENVEVENTVNYSDNYIREWGVVLVTTDTTNDSIKIEKDAFFDGLSLINTKETSEERSYIFDIAGTQTLHESLLATTSGTLNIIGFNNEGDSSVIDANGYGLFDLSNATTLNIEGVTLANASGDAIKVSDQAELNLTNVLFENNGGNAISASGNVNINVKDTDIAMSENIVMENAELNLNVENGALNLSNEISGSAYNLNIQSGNVNINGNVSGVKDFRLGGESVLGLGTSSRISVENLISGDITTFGMRSAQNATLEIDTEISNNQITNGVIDVSGDVSGSYNVIVNALSTEYASEKSVFLKAINDNSSTSSDFSVLRVKGSPYMWETILNANGETDGSNWYLAMKKANTTPEIVSGVGLQIAGIEQTRSVVRNVSGKVSNLSTYCPNCGIVPDAWDGKKLRNAWVSVVNERSNVEKPVEMEAKIQGIESGIDIQKDMNNNLGMFVSYRNGEYELSGKGETYSSEIGSDMEIDSYLAGLYYRYDRNNSFLFASIYGGKQEANVKTEDGVANYTTEGLEFGAGTEIGHSYELSKSFSISPSLGLYYKQISYDEAEDNVGKSYEWEDIKHIEAELSVKITKRFENGKIYVKPSIIQTLTDGDKVTITNLEETETYKDQTLGRVEVGGNFNLNDKWSAYGWSHYTYGSGYDATAVGLGVSYNW